MNEKISELYFNPEFPASLSSLGKFYKEAKKVIKNQTRQDVKKWSKQSNTYTKHKSARKTFNSERIYTSRHPDVGGAGGAMAPPHFFAKIS